MKQIILLFLLVYTHLNFAQIRNLGQMSGGNFGQDREQGFENNGEFANDEVKVKLSGKTHYTDYRKITLKGDTIVIDTTLTIKKEYKFNFLRKDTFELLPFHNQGQTFTTLAYDFSNPNTSLDIGFSAKQFGYMGINDVTYYKVPTQTSEIMARTGIQQGQVLDALFTANLNPRLNVSIAYKGLRSLGDYRQSLSSIGNFRATLMYQSPEKRYELKTHYTSQDVTNQESGGLPELSLKYFRTNEEDFKKRGRIDVNLNDTESYFVGKRIYVNQSYKLFSSKDTTNTKCISNIKLGYEFMRESKTYGFHQNTVTKKFFGETAHKSAVSDTVRNVLMNNQAYLEFNSKYLLGRFKVKANYTTVNYGYDSLVNKSKPISKFALKSYATYLGADWNGQIGKFHINADMAIIPGKGHLSGNYLIGEAYYKKDSLYTLKARLSQISKSPDFNYKLFQSVYDNYNWSNDFDLIHIQNLGGSILSKWGNAHFDMTTISNYTYFDEYSKPQQYNYLLSYFKIKIEKEFKLWRFALNNTLLYQEVLSGSEVFRVPRFITRNTLYYTDQWFKGKPLLVNIGVTFKYFTKYKMNAYNPLLAEFTLQNKQEIGYPTFDVFFNARVRRARFFFKIDNVTSKWSNRDYFSAPYYPYLDFTFRFGVVWNWFI